MTQFTATVMSSHGVPQRGALLRRALLAPVVGVAFLAASEPGHFLGFFVNSSPDAVLATKLSVRGSIRPGRSRKKDSPRQASRSASPEEGSSSFLAAFCCCCPGQKTAVRPSIGSVEDVLSWDFDALAYSHEELKSLAKAMLSSTTWYKDPATASPSSDVPFTTDQETVDRFVDAVYAKYNDVPYHNFHHAFSVMLATGLLVFCSTRLSLRSKCHCQESVVS